MHNWLFVDPTTHLVYSGFWHDLYHVVFGWDNSD